MLFYTEEKKLISVFIWMYVPILFKNLIHKFILFLLSFWNKCCYFVLPCDTWIYYRRVNITFSLHPASWNITLQPRVVILSLHQMWCTKSGMFCVFPVIESTRRYSGGVEIMGNLNLTLWHKVKELTPCKRVGYFWVNRVFCLNNFFHTL